ncbi:MAG TPA: phage tail protein [Polyangia bacterium]|nr:phage tail protein [Polyangia bacterium]
MRIGRAFLVAMAAAGCAQAAGDVGEDPTGAAPSTIDEVQSAATIALPPRQRLALVLDGRMVGWLDAASGGHASGEVLTVRVGADASTRKQIGAVKYEDISLTVGAGMAPDFYQWLQDTIDHKQTSTSRRDGAVVTTDYQGNVISQMSFFRGLISQIGFPALDASSKEPAQLTVVVTPEMTRYERHAKGAPLSPLKRPRRWSVSDFSVTIDGLDTTGVASVGPFVIKQDIVDFREGAGGGTQKLPGALEIPNLVVQLSDRKADAWFDWFQSFVLDGDSGANNEKTGLIHYLSPDLKEDLFTIELHGLGIFKLEPSSSSFTGDRPPTDEADMYCNDARLSSAPKN